MFADNQVNEKVSIAQLSLVLTDFQDQWITIPSKGHKLNLHFGLQLTVGSLPASHVRRPGNEAS